MLEQPAFNRLKLVVLASCHSSLVAHAFFPRVPHVISVPDGTAVPDHICNEFSKELYSNLLLDVGVEDAFKAASRSCSDRKTPWFELRNHAQREASSSLLGRPALISRAAPQPSIAPGLFTAAERKPAGESTPQVRSPIAYELGNLPDWRHTTLVNPRSVYNLRKQITDGLKRGCISHLHVFGPPGVGKSRTAAEACRHMSERGERVTVLGVRFPSSARSAAYPHITPGVTPVWRVVAAALRLSSASEAVLLRSIFALGDFHKLLLLDGVDAWLRHNISSYSALRSLSPPTAAACAVDRAGTLSHDAAALPSAYPSTASAAGGPEAGEEHDAFCIEDFVVRAQAQSPGQGLVITTSCSKLSVADSWYRADPLPSNGLAAADLLMRRLSRPVSAHHLVPTMGNADEQRFADWHALRAALRRSPLLRETGFIPRVIEHLAGLLEQAVARNTAASLQSDAVAAAYTSLMQQGPQDHSAGARRAMEPDCGWSEDALALCMNNLRQLPVSADPYSDQHLWLSLQESQLSEKQAEVHKRQSGVPNATGSSAASIIGSTPQSNPVWPASFHAMALLVSACGELAPANVQPTALKQVESVFPHDGVAQWVWLRACSGRPGASQAAVMNAVAAAARVLMGNNCREFSAAHRECIEAVLCVRYCAALPGVPKRSDELVAQAEIMQAKWKSTPLSLDGNSGTGSFQKGWQWMGATLKVLCNGLRDMWNARSPEVLRGFERLCVAQADFISAPQGSFMLTFSESQPGCIRVMWGVDWGSGSYPKVVSDCTRLLDEFGHEFEFGGRRGALANLLQHNPGCLFILPSRVEKTHLLRNLLRQVGGQQLQHQGSLPVEAVGRPAGLGMLARQHSAPAASGAPALHLALLRTPSQLHAPRDPSGAFHTVPAITYGTWPEQFAFDIAGQDPPPHRKQNWHKLKQWCEHFSVVPVSFSQFLG